MVLEMGGKWSHSCRFLTFCFQDLFSLAHSFIVQFLSGFFSMHFFSIYIVVLTRPLLGRNPDGTFLGTTNPVESEAESNSNDGVLNILQDSCLELYHQIPSYPEHSLRVLLLCKGAFGVFYIPSLQGWCMLEYICKYIHTVYTCV